MSTEQLFWDMVKQHGQQMLKRIPTSFMGKGEKEGYRYYRLQSSRIAYLYRVTHVASREEHFEITERWKNQVENRELYPYEEPIISELITSVNSSAAMQIWLEVTRNGGIQKAKDNNACI